MKDIGELREYLNNKQPITLNLYNKYKNKVNDIRGLKVNITCEKCNKQEIVLYDVLQNRKEIICQSCYRFRQTEQIKLNKTPQELHYYFNNKISVPFNLFLKYKNQLTGINHAQHHVSIDCKYCNEKVEMTWKRLQNREKFINEEICYNCVSIIGKQQQYNIPVELQFKGSKDNPILWEQYLKYKDTYKDGCKKWIKIQCIECNQEKLIQWRKVRNRVYSKDLAICNDCIQKYKANIPEVKEINSEAQKIAQNKPETIKLRNKKVKLACNTDKMKKIRRRNANKLWSIKEYRNKIFGNKRTLKGYYKNIKFDSSYELSFILYYEGNVIRCDEIIPYYYAGGYHQYSPDFILFENNKKIIVEIKGYDDDIVKIKKEYAIEFVKNTKFDEYRMYYQHDLAKLDNFKFITCNEDLKNLEDLSIIVYPKNWK